MRGPCEKWNAIVTEARLGVARDLGILILRVGFGLYMAAHGWGKLASYAEKAAMFPDPLGVGPHDSMALCVFAEFFCALGLVVGLATRLALIPLIINMAVAAFVIHAGAPFFAPPGTTSRELPLLYLIPFAGLFLIGPGRFSLDHLIGKACRARCKTQP